MSSKEKNETRFDIYARITERIVAQLEEGVRPWLQPWRASNAAWRIIRPLRHNGEPYSGMSVLLLWSEAMARGYVAPIWMTFKQATELGAHVRKGETSSTVIYASRFTKTDTDMHGGEVERDIPALPAYGVFNVEQIDGLPEHYYHRPVPVIDPVERIESAVLPFATAALRPIMRLCPTISRCLYSRRSGTPSPVSPCSRMSTFTGRRRQIEPAET